MTYLLLSPLFVFLSYYFCETCCIQQLWLGLWLWGWEDTAGQGRRDMKCHNRQSRSISSKSKLISWIFLTKPDGRQTRMMIIIVIYVFICNKGALVLKGLKPHLCLERRETWIDVLPLYITWLDYHLWSYSTKRYKRPRAIWLTC